MLSQNRVRASGHPSYLLHSSFFFFFEDLFIYLITLNCEQLKHSQKFRHFSMEVMNKFITIKSHINGAPHESDFEIKTATFSLSVESRSNDVVVKSLYLSIDPYQINRMKSYSSSQNTISAADGIVPGEVSHL